MALGSLAAGLIGAQAVAAAFQSSLRRRAEELGLPGDSPVLRDVRSNSRTMATVAGVQSGLFCYAWYWAVDRLVVRRKGATMISQRLWGRRVLRPLPLLVCVGLEALALAPSLVAVALADTEAAELEHGLAVVLTAATGRLRLNEAEQVVTVHAPARRAVATVAQEALRLSGLETTTSITTGSAPASLVLSTVLYAFAPLPVRAAVGALVSSALVSAESESSFLSALDIGEEASTGLSAHDRADVVREVLLAAEWQQRELVGALSFGQLEPTDGGRPSGAAPVPTMVSGLLAACLLWAKAELEAEARRRGDAGDADAADAARLCAGEGDVRSLTVVTDVMMLAAAMPDAAAALGPPGAGIVVVRDADGVGFDRRRLAALFGAGLSRSGPGSAPMAPEALVRAGFDAAMIALGGAAVEADGGLAWTSEVMQAAVPVAEMSASAPASATALLIGVDEALAAAAGLRWGGAELLRSLDAAPAVRGAAREPPPARDERR